MKEKIEAKVAEIIDSILAKAPEDISYNEYRILDSKLYTLKYEEEQKKNKEDMAALMSKTLGFATVPVSHELPNEVKED